MAFKQSQLTNETRRSDSASAHQAELSQRTRIEHDDLLLAMNRLEAALASPAPGRAAAWAHRVARELPLVCNHLRSHAESAEGANGLYAELTSARPEIAYRVEQLRTEHARLLDLAAALSDSIQETAGDLNFSDIRGQAAQLLSAFRGHHAREVDLIYECFCTDIGVGD